MPAKGCLSTEWNTLSDGEYQLNGEWDVIAELQRNLRGTGAPALWGVGATVGRATLFGHPRSFDGRSVRSFGLSLTAQIPFAHRHSAKDIDFSRTEKFGCVPLADVDPRYVEASQPGLQRAAIYHYLTVPYEATGELYDKTRNASNDWPVVFENEGSGDLIVLQGHHRAVCALLNGRRVRARIVRGRLRKGIDR